MMTPNGKARDTEQMKTALKRCVRPGFLVVHDCWWASSAALRALDYDQAPAVNHSKGFREHVEGQRSGWHSSDIESEFSRFKRFVRARFGILQTRGWGPANCGTLLEWQLRTNYPHLAFQGWMEAAAAGARAP